MVEHSLSLPAVGIVGFNHLINLTALDFGSSWKVVGEVVEESYFLLQAQWEQLQEAVCQSLFEDCIQLVLWVYALVGVEVSLVLFSFELLAQLLLRMVFLLQAVWVA